MLEKHTYCVKCQTGKTIIGQSPVIMKNGSVALKGRCPSCDSVAYKIVNKDALKNEDQPSGKVSSESHIGLALATFALGLAIGAAVALYI